MSDSNIPEQRKKTDDRPVEIDRKRLEQEMAKDGMYFESKPMTTSDKVAAGIFGTLITGFIGFVIWAGVKDEQKRLKQAEEAEKKRQAEEAEKKRKREELELWKEDRRNAGYIVQRLYTGEWMAVPAETYKDAEFRKS